jgi:small-conductance mechanosensitive channel
MTRSSNPAFSFGAFMRRRAAIVAMVLSFPAACFAAAAAQIVQEPAAPAKNQSEAISPGDIPTRADADERYAREVAQRAAERDPSAALAPRLEALALGVSELSGRYERDELQLLPPIRLESLDRYWAFYAHELEEWRSDLRRATARYSDGAAGVALRRASWESTRAAIATGGTSALVHRVDSVLAQLALAEQAVSRPLDRQIRLSRRAGAIEADIAAGQEAIDDAVAYTDSRLTRIDALPLWEWWGAPLRRPVIGSSDDVRSNIETGFLRQYVAANGERLRLHAAFLVILLPVLMWLRVRSRQILADDPELESSARVLLRPVSSWLVIGLMGALFFEPDAPVIVHELVMLLVLIPVLRLLPRQVFEMFGPWPYVTTGLYLLHRLGLVFADDPAYLRLYLLGITLLTLVLLVWLLVEARRRALPGSETTPRKAVRLAGWLAVAGLIVSAVSNVIGNVSLAAMLTKGLLDAGYIGLVLYAGASVLVSTLRLLLGRHALSRYHVVTKHSGPLLQATGKLIRFGAFVVWVLVVLNEFRVMRPLRDWLFAVLTHPIVLGELSLSLGGVLVFAFSVYLAFWVARTVRLVLDDDVLPKMPLPRGVGNSISSLTYYALLLVGLMVALAAAGFEVSQLALVFGALGVGIGFGLQNVVNNFVSGLILMFERPIQPGDVVEITGTQGKVREIGMRATTLTTFEGAEVVVPNGTLLSEKLINWTLRDMNRRLDVNLGVAYGTDARRVLELLEKVTRGTPGIAPDPEPAFVFLGLGPNALEFGIRAWTNDFGDWVAIKSELVARVYEALREARIEIPFPQHDLHLRSVSPKAGAALGGLRAAEPARDAPPSDPPPAA